MNTAGGFQSLLDYLLTLYMYLNCNESLFMWCDYISGHPTPSPPTQTRAIPRMQLLMAFMRHKLSHRGQTLMQRRLAQLHLVVSLFMKVINRTMWGKLSQIKNYHTEKKKNCIFQGSQRKQYKNGLHKKCEQLKTVVKNMSSVDVLFMINL